MKKNKINIIILIAISIIFFIIYSLLSLFTPQKFTSPDENVNLYFANHYATTGTLRYYEPLNSITDGYTRPRNTSAFHNNVAPNGFVGFYLLYGTLGSLYPQLIPYITPLLAIIGGVFLYCISKTIYDSKVALMSVILLFILPPYWFWSSMSMFNNIAATVFLVGGLAFIFLGIKNNNLGYYIASGLCFGMNHIIRLTDITYFIPLSVILFSYRKQINIKYLLIASTFYVTSLLPIFILNNRLFGSPLSFGYTSDTTTPNHNMFLSLFNKLMFFLLPSGIRLKEIIYSTSTYLIGLLPIFFLFGIIELTSVKNDKDSDEKVYLISYLLLSVWILIYYGSGIFWGLEGFTLDASYIRYFLPMYVLIVPLISKRLLTISPVYAVGIIFIFVVISITNVYQLKGGLNDIQARRISADIQSKQLLQLTEKDSIIITTLSDKILFPDRKVVVYGPVYNTVPPYKKVFTYDMFLQIIVNLTKYNKNIYLLNDRTDLDIKKVRLLLQKFNLKLNQSNQDEYLYKISKA